jgi:hypothetical protein
MNSKHVYSIGDRNLQYFPPDQLGEMYLGIGYAAVRRRSLAKLR